MPYPILSDKTVNNKTRVDISVPSYKEIEGPLGGISVEYDICVVAERQALDPNCTSNHVIEYKTLKSYRECEDFYAKLCSKHAAVNFPELPKTYSHPCTLPETRQEALDHVMKFISSTLQSCSSPELLSFLGIEFTDGTKIVSNITEPEISVDDNTIFKKIKIKNKNTQSSDTTNANGDDLMEDFALENENSEILDEDFDEMFKEPVTRKRNETGSKPLFDELSLIKRSEQLHERELLLFDSKNYGGPISNTEEDVFLIPEAKTAPDTYDSMDDTEDQLTLLSVNDDLDQFFAKVNKQSTSNKNADIVGKIPNTQSTNRPIPPPKPCVPSKPTQSLPVSDIVANATKEKPAVPLKPIPAARNRASRPIPQPRKHIDTDNAKKSSVSTVPVERSSIDSVDILKYIEDEQKNANDEPDLFS